MENRERLRTDSRKSGAERSRITRPGGTPSWRGTEIGVSELSLHDQPQAPKVRGCGTVPPLQLVSVEQPGTGAELDGALCVSPGLAHASAGGPVGPRAGPDGVHDWNLSPHDGSSPPGLAQA